MWKPAWERDLEFPCRPKRWKKREKWKELPGEFCNYEISNMGRVRNKNKVYRGPKRRYHLRTKNFLYIKKRDNSVLLRSTVTRKRKNVAIKKMIGKLFFGENIGGVSFKDKNYKNDCSIYNLRLTKIKHRKKNQRKLTKKQVLEIKKLLYTPMHPNDIAKLYGVSSIFIYKIKNGERWYDI